MANSSLVNGDLVTQEQLAEEFGIAVSTVSKWLKDVGAAPISIADHNKHAPAFYDHASVIRSFQGKFENIAAPVIASEKATAIVAANIIEKMRADKSREGTKAIMANAVGFMQMMAERIGELEDKNQELEKDAIGWQSYAGMLKDERDISRSPEEQKKELERFIEEKMRVK